MSSEDYTVPIYVVIVLSTSWSQILTFIVQKTIYQIFNMNVGETSQIKNEILVNFRLKEKSCAMNLFVCYYVCKLVTTCD